MMQNETPTVQAIIVTWNKKADVLRLLAQLRDIDYPENKLSLLVVDNNSTDGTVHAITSDYPSVKLITHCKNLGGAGGFNAGMRWTIENRPEAEYIWLLDNDIQVDSNALAALVAAMTAHPGAAICGSRIMNIDNRNELIEAGAFIDYHSGEIRCNRPDKKSFRDSSTAFKVDYVAACSLLARVSHVKKMGIWREEFFIYWDDMEWGMRFNRAGYDVLASNASIVYHPSWVQRVTDYSAVWRNYYRTRNSLWVFNNYCGDIERRLLLCRMIYRFMRYAASNCLISQTGLSRAYTSGIAHFFMGKYGKKNFDSPVTDIATVIGPHESGNLPVFVPDVTSFDKITAFIDSLIKKVDRVELKLIVPERGGARWKNKYVNADLMTYKRSPDGAIALRDKIRILKFLKNCSPWRMILSPLPPPKMASIWGRFVAKIDLDRGAVISIERVRMKDLLRIIFTTPVFLCKALFFPPKKSD
jgi:GT2 family glycosyltransferase